MPHQFSVIAYMKFVFLIVLLSFLFVGCDKAPNKVIDSYMSLPVDEIRMVVSNSVPQWENSISITDEEYIIPTEEWVKGKFSSTLSGFLFDYGASRYVEESNDCDDFALYGRAIANVMNRNNPDSNNRGVAVGEVFCFLNGIDGHALNFIVVAGKDKKPKVIFYEPQSQQVIRWNTNDWMVIEWNM